MWRIGFAGLALLLSHNGSRLEVFPVHEEEQKIITKDMVLYKASYGIKVIGIFGDLWAGLTNERKNSFVAAKHCPDVSLHSRLNFISPG